jgi:N utilization substance protein B
MTRKTARQIAVQLLFSMDLNELSADEALELFFSPEHYESLAGEDDGFREEADENAVGYIRRLTGTVCEHREELDEVISRYARGWKTGRLSAATRAILRTALCEILYFDDVPDGAAVNEAVELGKAFDSPEAAAFINGVLGSYLRAEKPAQTE